MSNDFGINSTGMGDKVTKKPKKSQEKATEAKQEKATEAKPEAQAPTPPPGRNVPEESPKVGFFNRIKNVFKKPDPTPPQPAPKSSAKEIRTLRWQVPSKVSAVYVKVYDENGKVKGNYNISNFITLKSGYTVELKAE